MKKIFLLTIVLFMLNLAADAQDTLWTMEACMRYAVENSPAVKKTIHASDTYQAEYVSSITSFLPSISAEISATYSFGRNVDVDYNVTEQTTFSNPYNGYASLPVFNGGILINQWRKAKINRKAGKNDVRKEKDDLAIKTMAAFVDVVYYKGTTKFAEEKLNESKRLLFKTGRMEELGLKGKADIAQIEAQVAADDYSFTRQTNLYNVALASLKDLMNYPSGQKLEIDTLINNEAYIPELESITEIYEYAKESNPSALKADYLLQAYKMQHKIEKGKLLPAISLNAGIRTNYFEDLNFEYTPEKPLASFKNQLKDKRGEYVGLTMSIPIFNRLNGVTNVRRARNNVRIAIENQTEIHRQLQTAIEKAVLEREGFAKESIQMEKKVLSEEYAYQVTLRKFEEGLMSSLDLQTSSNILIQSKADLLQKRLMYLIKCKEVAYYKGEPLVVIND